MTSNNSDSHTQNCPSLSTKYFSEARKKFQQNSECLKELYQFADLEKVDLDSAPKSKIFFGKFTQTWI